MQTPFPITFPTGQIACAVSVQRIEDLFSALGTLGLRRGLPTISIVGGAAGLGSREKEPIRQLLREVLIPLAQTLNVTIVDGGTDTGVMQMVGQARSDSNSDFQLVGVIAIGTVISSDSSAGTSGLALSSLEPGHTHFVLVPGSEWGDESPWLSRVATGLAAGAPSMTILINGGDISWIDVSNSIQAARPVLIIEGSGRTADMLAVALHDKAGSPAASLVSSGLLRGFDITGEPAELARVITTMLSREE